MTTLQLARLKELNASGLYDTEIASRLGVSRETIARYRKKLGLAAVKDNHTHKKYCYKVFDTKTHKLLAYGNAHQVTAQLELSSVDCFYSIGHNVRTGQNRKYRIEKIEVTQEQLDFCTFI